MSAPVYSREQSFTERPCAAQGLISYRYKGRYGFVMIGAKDDSDALREADRSTNHYGTTPVDAAYLEVWNGERYQAVQS